MSRSMFQIGPYDVIAELGRDALGTTYLGRDTASALVAVTHIDEDLARDSRFREALDRAGPALRTQDPNLVAVDVGVFGYGRFLASPYHESATLGDLLAVTPTCEPAVLARILRDVLAGLATAHESGHLHLHLSPDRILIGHDGVARVSELGLAEACGIANPGLTPYTAPHVLGEPLDARADVFAIGAIAWSALTGHVLFAGRDESGTRERLLSLPVPPPSEVGAKPPSSWDEVILRALARDPADRQASVHELASALTAAIPDAATHAEVGLWVESTFTTAFARRREHIANATADTDPTDVPVCALREVPPPDRRRRFNTGTGRAVGLLVGAFAAGIAVALVVS
ncbi:MAG: serine/threonine-protein kinase [Kofleriaceae bacterium]